MLVLFVAAVVFAVTFYVEGLVPSALLLPDGREVDCGTVLAPANAQLCDGASTIDVWATAITLVLMVVCVAAMVTLGVRRSRRAWR